jgi:hypothetical protein
LSDKNTPLTFEPAGYSLKKTSEGMAEEFQFDVFLGHSAKDKSVVRELANCSSDTCFDIPIWKVKPNNA